MVKATGRDAFLLSRADEGKNPKSKKNKDKEDQVKVKNAKVKDNMIITTARKESKINTSYTYPLADQPMEAPARASQQKRKGQGWDSSSEHKPSTRDTEGHTGTKQRRTSTCPALPPENYHDQHHCTLTLTGFDACAASAKKKKIEPPAAAAPAPPVSNSNRRSSSSSIFDFSFKPPPSVFSTTSTSTFTHNNNDTNS